MRGKLALHASWARLGVVGRVSEGEVKAKPYFEG